MFESRIRTDLRQQAIDLVKRRGYEYRDDKFKLASGEMSHDYIDGKYAVDDGPQLALISQAIIELASEAGMDYCAVGGLTMGADALAHGVAILAGKRWFSVRKEPKPRGREAWIEGTRFIGGEQVLLVDDVVTSGGSILLAYDKVIDAGATVAGVIPMVDRSNAGGELFGRMNVPYAPLITYHDLGIDPVGRTFAGAVGN